jgi:hypothetical protein
MTKAIEKVDDLIIKLGGDIVDTWDKWAYLAEKINSADIKGIITDVTDQIYIMQDALTRAARGDIFADMKEQLEDFWVQIKQIELLSEEGFFGKGEAGELLKDEAITTAIEYYTQQVENYFSAIQDNFDDFALMISQLELKEIYRH